MFVRTAIPGLEGRYAASESGDVYSLVRGEVMRLRPYLSNDGYLRVSIYVEGKKRSMSVHRLVASTFIPRDSVREYVNHKNGIKTDNRRENLEWVTKGENIRHAVATGLHNMRKKRDQVLVSKAKELRSDGLGYAEIATAIGRSISTAFAYVQQR